MQVRYDGPYSALEVDGIRIERGDTAEISDEQYERVKSRGVTVLGGGEGITEPAPQPRGRRVDDTPTEEAVARKLASYQQDTVAGGDEAVTEGGEPAEQED